MFKIDEITKYDEKTNQILDLIDREEYLFTSDMLEHEEELERNINKSSFLVIGGAGTIGQAVVKEIFKRHPKKLHVVDINENNLVELVRDLRSSFGYIDGEFRTFSLDVGSIEYDAFIKHDGQYEYVLNLSALKHVRSEEDPFTLMRMIDVNIFNTNKTLEQSIAKCTKKYFCVSTDKATNPVNMMGASKRIMEMFLMQKSNQINISTARFANVAFSDGSLLFGFDKRIEKRQPIVAPKDIKRYFITPQESGELCLMSCIMGGNRDIFFPKSHKGLRLTSFADIAIKYLEMKGFEPYLCTNEEEARRLVKTLPDEGKWPCLFTVSDTTGEKEYEEFYTKDEVLNMNKFTNIGIIKNDGTFNKDLLQRFIDGIAHLKNEKSWSKKKIVDIFMAIISDFNYRDVGKYLDSKM
jgi:UDP-N-acetylglucosamine 4,6-dehydratase